MVIDAGMKFLRYLALYVFFLIFLSSYGSDGRGSGKCLNFINRLQPYAWLLQACFPFRFRR